VPYRRSLLCPWRLLYCILRHRRVPGHGAQLNMVQLAQLPNNWPD
jgi:hypothetical protein